MKKGEIFSWVQKAYEQNKMFETILFEGENQKELEVMVNEISRFLYCQNHRFNSDNCSNCKNFDEQRILDFYQLGDGFLSINKESLKTVLDEFDHYAKVINQPKILVIANAENLKIDAANSLLKFLEEPTKNTFLFLLTKNKNEVLPTIKSRTKIFKLEHEVVINEDNFLVKAIATKKEDIILLLNNKMKKMSKEALIESVQEALPVFLNQKALKLYQLGLELVNDLKFDSNANLAIDKFLIEVVGE